MKRVVLLVLMAAAAISFAGVVSPFKQFTQADYNDYAKPGQNWIPANMITLSVKANTDVWLSNYVNSWFGGVPDLHGDQFDMLGATKYGYIFKSDLPDVTVPNGTYDDKINWSDGNIQTDITYFDDKNPSIQATTKGYFLDHFDKDAEIYLVMTTLEADGNETVDTFQYVQDANNDTSLMSRQHNTFDLAGNVRVNLGIDSETFGEIGREFVAVYNGATGSPLPSLLLVALLSSGTVFGASRMKAKKRS